MFSLLMWKYINDKKLRHWSIWRNIDKAIFMGDFNSEVTEAVKWLEEKFEQKFEWPILADKERLFYKLKS